MQQPYMVHTRMEDARLYQQYAPAIFAYLIRNVVSREDAEDLLLDIFLAALQKSSSADVDAQRLQSWIWAVARNKVVDYHRRNRYRANVQLTVVEETLYESDEQAPENVALRNEEYQQLYVILQELPEIQREIVQLRFGHGLTCGEIASVIQKSEGAVRMTLHRTLKLLRSLYSKDEKGGRL
jgi:RNA polymerase sigma-70 factor (ECF subfamily)